MSFITDWKSQESFAQFYSDFSQNKQNKKNSDKKGLVTNVQHKNLIWFLHRVCLFRSGVIKLDPGGPVSCRV